MSYSSEEETDISDSELEDYSEKVYQQLLDGKLAVKISGDVYRCPYCSQKKRKQQYGFRDLLQHASAIGEGSGSKRDTKEKGKHLGLMKYLENLGQRKPPERNSPEDLRPVQNGDNNELLVYPWVGIVANLPLTFENGRYVGGSGTKLRNEFIAQGFNPKRVNPLWNYKGHTGFAVVEFGKDWPGFHCAMKFGNSFEAAGKGKQDYLNMQHRGTEIYGWIGREDDFYSEKAIGDFLRKFGDLKTVHEIEAEEKRKSNKLLSNLSNVIEEKAMHLKEIEVKYHETTLSLGSLMNEMDKMFQACDEARQKMQQNTRAQIQNIVNEHQKMKLELEQREKDLQKREARNDSERKKLALEKEMNERATLEQKKADENVIKLAEDHKREKEELRKRSMELEKQINAKQGLELEIECLRGSLSVMKHMENPEDSKFKQKINDTQNALKQKEEELEDLEALNQVFVVKERKTNDELQEARKELINFLKGKPKGPKQWLGVKGMGELDGSPFHAACNKKYGGPDAEEKAAELISLWEDNLRDPNWYPFKIVTLQGGNDHKEIINLEDEKLKKLGAEWGNKVQTAVTTALKEMNQYNPSGRYIIWELWNYKEERKATLAEGASYLLDLRAKKRSRT
ncbi:hypothetical protein DCAR_0832011 [Daucus carota subsp. sativus]|uniref:Factor of DNA methylation 1-5/IDN2 domain-containing protein n=1 Tax=Daucus carota subsp. sativus TaxID=79200 RepID=A0AAF0XSJ0_DAUCS|nr:PREDICTED: protein INVOLVED IN DE NOVO 2-like isoform X1 [Daucus carota subsp. sativus]XP_017223484.1 PREDICTED: protein INVOLVED IN DE NOVO 2-like isoform X1 [Daucus carota subsp. sativus]XP_017223485.1 PREDICTED: protein INVOLVED IN DE NOVO 2-like isoform X1 [Daucus carota subsp. sativus]XP_017223486.1 PREDICTED: protein INVOLVED IN DE NOVO 2-like isoform X2 [Daucus carota subsp. sativus]WOH12507.1 hypothetical protein DCAR_0832011 [Daucus carota subsp. sativus]